MTAAKVPAGAIAEVAAGRGGASERDQLPGHRPGPDGSALVPNLFGADRGSVNEATFYNLFLFFIFPYTI